MGGKRDADSRICDSRIATEEHLPLGREVRLAASLLLLALAWAGCDLGDELDGVLPIQGGTNTPPVAVAGEDRQCRLGEKLWFDGSRSYDPDGRIIGYEWDFGDGSPPVREAVVQHLYPAAGEYAVTLRVMDDHGGVAEDSVRVVVAGDQQEALNGVGCENNQPPVAHAGDNRYVYITNDQPVNVSFNGGGSYDPDSGQTIAEYYWDFGNGQLGSGPTPSTTYRDSGTYIVTLLVKDNCGEWSPVAATCRVFVSANSCAGNQSPVALAGFNPSSPVACQPISFTAVNSYDPDSGQSLTYTWSFGDGGTATGRDVTYSYPNTGTYYATLTVTDPCGASGTRTVTVTVRPNNMPNANADGNKNGTACQPVTFNGSGSWDPDAGQTLTHTWNFGDGSPVESGAVVTHAYAVAGTYTVRLTVTDNCGASAVATVYATIYAAGPCQCNQSPTANAGLDKTGYVGQAITFNGSGSDPDAGQTLTYSWTSGHGQTANTPTATFTYDTPGTYTVTLTVSDGCVSVSDTAIVTILPVDPCAGNRPPVANAGPDKTGYVGELISFSGSGSSDPDSGQTLSYAWNFGDGSPSGSGVNVSHSYGAVGTYTVTLTVTDPCGATATDTAVVTVPNRPPVANAGPDKSGYVGQAITFNGSGSDPDAGQTLTYSWTSGDGQTANTPTATFTYNTAGTYTAALTVRDPHNATATDTAVATITVQDPCAGNRPPVANAGPDKTGYVGELISFSGSGSSDPDSGQTLSYAWNFGDGSPSGSGVNVSHSYGAVGTYTVTLTVTDPCGATATDTAVVTVPNRPPVANAGPDKSGYVGQAITFNGSGSDPDAGQTLTYSWTSGDGQTANTPTATFTYNTAGTYTAALTVRDPHNATATDTAVATITVQDPCAGNRPPVANAGPDKTGYVGELISFSGSGSSDPDSGQTLSYAWNFGDGSPSGSGVNVSHSYGAVGTYTVTLTVTDPCGATATDTAVVTVPNRPPVANAGPDKSGYVGQAITFNGSGSDPDAGQTLTYSWTSGHGQTANTPNATFTYNTAGTYTVTLTITDNCGSTATDTAVVTVTVPPPLQAAFVVKAKELNEAGEPVWQEIDVNEPVELGRNLMFDASGSTGPVACYMWAFGDSGQAYREPGQDWPIHAYTSSGTFNATLTVYDAAWNSSSAALQLEVDSGVCHVNTLVLPGVVMSSTQIGSWVGLIISQGSRQLLLWDVGDPFSPGPFQIASGVGLSETARSIASWTSQSPARSFVFVPNSAGGVGIYELVAWNTLSYVTCLEKETDLLGHSAAYLGVTRDRLFVGVQYPSKVFVFELAPLIQAQPSKPTGLAPCEVPLAQLSAMATSPQGYVTLRYHGSPQVYMINGRLSSPVLENSPITLNGTAVVSLSVDQSISGTLDSTGTRLITTTFTQDNEMSAVLAGGAPGTIVPDGSDSNVVTDSRLYAVNKTQWRVMKYDITSPAAPVFMQSAATPGAELGCGFLYRDPDRDGLFESAIFLGSYGSALYVFRP